MVRCNKVTSTLRTAHTFAGCCTQVRNNGSNGTVHGISICDIIVVMVNAPSLETCYTATLSCPVPFYRTLVRYWTYPALYFIKAISKAAESALLREEVIWLPL